MPTEQLTDEEALQIEDGLNTEAWWEELAVMKARGDGKIAAQAIARLIERFKDELPEEFREAAERLLARAKGEYGEGEYGSKKRAALSKADGMSDSEIIAEVEEVSKSAGAKALDVIPQDIYARYRQLVLKGAGRPAPVEKAAPSQSSALREFSDLVEGLVRKSDGKVSLGEASLTIMEQYPDVYARYAQELRELRP